MHQFLCKTCKNIFNAKKKNRKYCSLKCLALDTNRLKRSKEQKLKLRGKGNPNYKEQPQSKMTGRTRARMKFKMTRCESCGTSGKDRHHKNHNTFDNRKRNIQILCRACHTRIHKRKRNKYGKYTT